MGAFQFKKFREQGGKGQASPQQVLAEGKYKAIITNAEEKSGPYKNGKGKWSGLSLGLNFTDEDTVKNIMVFNGSQAMDSLLKSLGYDVNEDFDLKLTDILGRAVIAYLTVSPDGQFNNVKEFRPVPKKGKPAPVQEPEEDEEEEA